MAAEIECPTCGESEDICGRQTDKGIRISCGACGASWLRDSVERTCATCGGTEVEERTRALTQYSRGTQLSIVGLGAIWLCRTCDQHMVEWSESGRAVPFSYRAAAEDSEAAAEREADGADGDVLMTP